MSLNTPQQQAISSNKVHTKAPEIGNTFQDHLSFLQEKRMVPRKQFVISPDTSSAILQANAADPNVILIMTNATQAQKDSLTHVAGSVSDFSQAPTQYHYNNLEYIGGSLMFMNAISVALPKLRICGGSITTTQIQGTVIAPVLELVRGKFQASSKKSATLSYPKLKAVGHFSAQVQSISLPALQLAGNITVFCQEIDVPLLEYIGRENSRRSVVMGMQIVGPDVLSLPSIASIRGTITIKQGAQIITFGQSYIHDGRLQYRGE